MANLNKAVEDLMAKLEAVSGRLQAVEGKLAGGAVTSSAPAASSSSTSASSGGDDGSSSPAVQGYDDLINEYIKPFEAVTPKFGTDKLKEQVGLFVQAINDQRSLIGIAATSKKPDAATFQGLIAKCGELMQQVVAIRNSSHKSEPDWNHLSSVSEAIQGLQWVCFNKADTGRVPAPVVKEMSDGAAFYFNPLLRKHKAGGDEPNEDVITWVNSLKGFFVALAEYVRKTHTQGLAWNPNGGDAKAASASAPSGGAPAPPGPPPAPAAPAPSAASSGGGAAAARSGLFAELNKGGAVTSGLKKVTRDMQTHKNPNLRAGGTVPAAKKPAAAPARKFGAASSAAANRPPVFELQGNKWVIENQRDNKTIVIDQTEVKHTVYLYRCEGCVVQVKGAKINAITVDSCKKTAVVMNNVVSGIEVINSQSIEVQTTGAVPNFAIDKCSSIQIYLSKDALDAQIVTSKSDSVNVSVPVGDDVKEFPVPEQFITTYADGELKTTTVQHE